MAHAQLAALSFAVMKLRYEVVKYNAYCRMIDRSVCTGAARSVFICVRTSPHKHSSVDATRTRPCTTSGAQRMLSSETPRC
jgi:hypothetical protein